MACDLCQTAQLCDHHLAMAYEETRGFAAGKGSAWAERVFRAVGSTEKARDWPQTPKMHANARRIVENEIHRFDRRLDDPRLAEKLSRTCAERAAERWSSLTRRYR